MTHLNTNSIARKVILNAKLTPALLLILSTLTLTTAASAAELVVNGGFEYPVVDTSVGWTTYYGENFSGSADCPPLDPTCNDGTLVPGWSVFWTDDIEEHLQLNPGRLEIQTGASPFEGLQKAELDSHHRVGNKNNNVTILQFLPTCPLSDYTLSYAWNSRTMTLGDNDTRVVIDGEQVAKHETNSAWEVATWDFTSDNTGQTWIVFGSIGDETTEGMFLDAVSVTGPDCSFVCDEKPYDITLMYDGNDDTDHGQSGNEVIISPEIVPSFPDSATIMVYDHKKKDAKWLGTYYDVGINDLFSVSNIKNNKRIPPRLTFVIYEFENEAAGPVQTVTFHTSCSQPLNGRDEFGAITVWNALP